MGRRAAKRGVNHARALLGKIGTDLSGGGRDRGPEIDQHGAFLDAGQDAVLAIDQLFDNGGGREAEHHDIAGCSQLGWRFGLRGAAGDDRRDGLLVEVHYNRFEAIFLQAFDHVAAHEAEADETNDGC